MRLEYATTILPLGDVVTQEFVDAVNAMQDADWAVIGCKDTRLPCGMRALALRWVRPEPEQ